MDNHDEELRGILDGSNDSVDVEFRKVEFVTGVIDEYIDAAQGVGINPYLANDDYRELLLRMLMQRFIRPDSTQFNDGELALRTIADDATRKKIHEELHFIWLLCAAQGYGMGDTITQFTFEELSFRKKNLTMVYLAKNIDPRLLTIIDTLMPGETPLVTRDSSEFAEFIDKKIARRMSTFDQELETIETPFEQRLLHFAMTEFGIYELDEQGLEKLKEIILLINYVLRQFGSAIAAAADFEPILANVNEHVAERLGALNLDRSKSAAIFEFVQTHNPRLNKTT